ncbi:class I SAM-dependent methyltransferase [Aliiroseovarius sp. KMU-50]|uniref:Class I SAM-dependent methyltransferase n=1 Tax=Aliiroseovarius salicola TaxID=3009082 RepID=A0ABT4W568_9RHOB|nr:class I SAM-dependent methyltransferase [Aliiroseovarius sp. KMU-50]MDA5095653.1 class I SAM-dependent methyltransferase [Aliiroseovarius sp. KMU-50]
MAHIEHLKTLCPLSNRYVVDIGAGDGIFSKQLHAEGAVVTAVEIDAVKVARAQSGLPVDVDVILGTAENLPLETDTQDLACFFFSFHHVPIELQDAAFNEAHRVLRPTGRLHIVEPFPFGSMFDVVRFVEDETFVRTHSHELLNRLGEGGRFGLLSKNDYVLTREYPSFDSFLDKIVRPDPDRQAAFEHVATEMEEAFDQAIDDSDQRRVLHQPCAAYHFAVKP